ncbi:MAG TPA: hypothetical protein VKU41_18410, partial [Polyangiaceae bacterium]|nr:hypothetical protein [Polyangiaceae bacterium]
APDVATRARQACVIQWSLPGMTVTAADIEACADGLSADCTTPCRLPPAGTLPTGAPCNPGGGGQCRSGTCVQVQLPDGGYPACGVCASSLSAGQACGTDPQAACTPGLFCSGSTSRSCAPHAAAGSPCSAAVPCATDLACSPSDHVCEAKKALGATCSADQECAQALPCRGGTCAPRADAGAPCTPSGYSSPCDFGLTCDRATSTCVPFGGSPGDKCGAGLPACVLGTCSKAGVCPRVIPDGQPCPTDDTATCDVAAECGRDGTCSIPGSVVCQ